MAGARVARICAELASHNFPLVGDDRQPIRTTSSTAYKFQCERIFDDAREFQRRKYIVEPKQLTPSQFQQITRFAKKHGLRIRICGYRSALPSTLSASAETINISPRVPFLTPEWLAWCLEHEYGHIRDMRLVATCAPELKKVLMEGRGGQSEAKRYVSALLRLMREGLSKSEAVEFDRLRNKVLGHIGQYEGRMLFSILRVLGELFRYGEHVLDERFEDYVMESDHFFIKDNRTSRRFYRKNFITNYKGERIDALRVMIVAVLQEAGLLERFI